MNKNEFLSALRERLNGLPEEDMNKSIDFYSEMIDERVEDGMSEEEAVEAIGPMDEIISQILSEVSLPKLVKEKVKPKQALRAWEIVLLILGAPLWITLILGIIVVILSLYLIIWCVILALYAIDLAIAISGILLMVLGGAAAIDGQFVVFGALFGIGLVCGGLAILLYFCFNLICKGILFFSKKMMLGIKALFIKK